MLRKGKTTKVIYDFHDFIQDATLTKNTIPSKRALVSYLVEPLLPPVEERDRSTFSNLGIGQYIPRALNELGYIVDIVNYDNRDFVPRKKYNLFVGHAGINFERIERKLDRSCIKIYFSTGIYWPEWNRMEKERLDSLQKRKGIRLPLDRQIIHEEEYANTHANGIICLGNEHAKSTYSKFSPVIAINNAVFLDTYSLSQKNFEIGCNNFLFFNGSGNVHKGLDLLLDAFSQMKDRHLYVRQNIEPEFYKAYKKELTELPNIHIIPFLNKPSKEFFEIMSICNFVISPTCAEGQPGSIIECMAHGLIPILSKEANIDTKNFGITLKDNSIDEIIATVKEVSQKPIGWHKNKSSLTMGEMRRYYSPEQFLDNMKNAINAIENKKDKTI